MYKCNQFALYKTNENSIVSSRSLWQISEQRVDVTAVIMIRANGENVVLTHHLHTWQQVESTTRTTLSTSRTLLGHCCRCGVDRALVSEKAHTQLLRQHTLQRETHNDSRKWLTNYQWFIKWNKTCTLTSKIFTMGYTTTVSTSSLVSSEQPVRQLIVAVVKASFTWHLLN